jgi:hypothetical protein
VVKQLYVVRWEIEAVVLAESEKDAYSVGMDAFHDIVDNTTTDVPDDVSPMQYLPGEWGLGALPFGDEGDVTIGEYIERGAAPAYSALKARLAALEIKLAKERP